MAKTKKRRRACSGDWKSDRCKMRPRRVFEELEPRLVLAPVVNIISFPEVSGSLLTPRFTFSGEWSGRIEAAPSDFFGGELFVIEREGTGAGRISRVDPGGTVRTFGELPSIGGTLGFGGGPTGFEGFDNFFDLVFDETGNFGGPLFVSITDQTIAGNNTIYSFGPPLAALGVGGDTVGLYKAGSSTFFLKNQNTPGPADQFFNYGTGGVGLVPVVGDWDGNGTDTVGLFDPTTSTFQLSNSNNSGPADLVFRFGPMASGWLPIVGDWDGDGTDTVGLYDAVKSRLFLRDVNAPGIADNVFRFGPMGSGWSILVGDWNGDGTDTPGLYDGAAGKAYLTDVNAPGPATSVFRYGPAGSGWLPIAGDWNGDGTETLGLYNQTTATEYLTNINGPGPATTVFRYGPAGAGWTPLAGAWNGAAASGLAASSIFAQFTTDSNSDFTFDDHPTALAFGLGGFFGSDLFAADTELEGEGPGPFPFPPENGGNDLYRVNSSGSLFLVDTINTVLVDVDPRAIAFNLNPAFDVSGFGITGGTLYMVSTDVEDTQLSTILQITGVPGSLTINTLFSDDIANFQFGDMAFDPRGFFGGNLFVTDHVTGSVYAIDDSGADTLFASGFNVGGLESAFSITFSDNGLYMYVSDQTGIWRFESDFAFVTSDAGRITGVFDIFELARPYTGVDLGAAVLDTGVDASHPGFGGHVTLGIDTVVGNSGNPFGGTLDTNGHGTATAGIVSQIVPDATIVPVKWDLGGVATLESIFDALKYVADNPTAVDPVTGHTVPIVVSNNSWGAVNSSVIFDSEVEAAAIDNTTLYPFKEQVQRAVAQGTYTVVSAGNEGLVGAPSGPALDGMRIPAAINEAVSVIATYPYGPSRLGVGPFPVGVPGLEAGDFISYLDKVTAFSSRSQDSDFAAPGTAVRAFNAPGSDLDLIFGLNGAPINPRFNGTSAAGPVVSGISVMTFSALGFWIDVAASGMSNATFLSPTGATLNLGTITNLAAYWNPDGINSILQWTAEPRMDVDLVTEDAVSQQRSIFDPTQFRNYSRIDVANAVGAIEGKIALDYFVQNPTFLSVIDTSGNGIMSAFEIQAFVDATPSGSEMAATQAMARLLGGTSSGSAFRRTEFFDRIDGTFQGGIRVSEVPGLAQTILPGPDAFPITGRIEAADQGYLLAPNVNRNWLDLTVHDPGTDFLKGPIPSEFLGKSPDELGNLFANVFFNPIDDPVPPGSGGGGGGGGGGECVPGEQCPRGSQTSTTSLTSSILAATATVDSTTSDTQTSDEDLAFAPSTGDAAEASVDSTSDAEVTSSGSVDGGATETDRSLDLALVELSDELALGGLGDLLA